MIRPYIKPGRKVQILFDKMVAGAVDTSGNLASWAEDVSDLPRSLRQWLWEEFDQIMEPDSLEYLKKLVRDIPDPDRVRFKERSP